VKLNETVTGIFIWLHDVYVEGKVPSGVISRSEYSGGMMWIF